jgi:hypothetical protein
MKNPHIKRNNLRLHKRHRCRYLAKIHFRYELLGDATILNISPEGLLLTASNNNIKPGSIIDITFECISTHTTIAVPAFVVHIEPEKMGVWLDDEDKILKSLIQTMIDNLDRNKFFSY